MITAIDPENNISDDSRERARKVLELSDKSFAQKVLHFLVAIKENPPNSDEQVERLLALWQSKIEQLENC